MKRYFLSLFLVLGLTLFVGVTKAQETENDLAAKYGVTFPIAELGNCTDLTECRTYCEDPVNQEACTSFAKEKGFYSEEEFKPDEEIVSRARLVLGCSSASSCRDFCEEEENFDRCHRFAQGAGLVGGYVRNPESGEFLNKAKEVLGCDSYGTCRNFCDNPSNRDKCSQFASEVGARGGYEYRGPGGCTSEETCSAFCSNPGNVEICRTFSEGHGGRFIGPGGCTDEDSCRSYCEKNPNACGGQEVRGDYNPAEMCSRTPNCSWSGTSCQCSSSSSFQGDPATECSKYGCSWTGTYCSCSSNSADYLDRQKTECSKYPGCSWSGDSCQCSTSNIDYTNYNSDPKTQCEKYSGCSWKDNWCQCGASPIYTGSNSGSGGAGSGSYTPYPYSTSQSGYSGNTMSREQQESTCRSGGGTCTWNNDVCNCQGYSSSGTGNTSTQAPSQTSTPSQTSQPDPAAQCNSYPGCSWSDGGCHCSSVQGIATVYVRTWWQRLLDLLQ